MFWNFGFFFLCMAMSFRFTFLCFFAFPFDFPFLAFLLFFAFQLFRFSLLVLFFLLVFAFLCFFFKLFFAFIRVSFSTFVFLSFCAFNTNTNNKVTTCNNQNRNLVAKHQPHEYVANMLLPSQPRPPTQRTGEWHVPSGVECVVGGGAEPWRIIIYGTINYI